MSPTHKVPVEIVRSWPKPGVVSTWFLLQDPTWHAWFQYLNGFAFGWAVLKLLRWWLG